MIRTFVGCVFIGAVALMIAGCNQCEKLGESICKDLGPEDCATWKELGGPESVIPGGRRPGQACGQLASNERAYEATVLGARGTVLAHRLGEATKTNDKEAIAKAKAAIDANTKAIMEAAKQ